MPSKLQMYTELSETVVTRLTGSYQEWTAFLCTAGRLYKYPFPDQMMIYAQRPNATACAEYDFWNEKMRRYVMRGSSGIALIDTSGDKARLRYVFDVADTAELEKARRPRLWQYRPEHQRSVSAALEARFGVSGQQGFATQIEAVSSLLAAAYWDDNQEDLLRIVDGSVLEEYDKDDIAEQFQNAAFVSIAYTIMSRCGLEPESYFSHEDFMNIFDFSTIPTATALGMAVSQSSEQVLRQIEAAIKAYEREKRKERSVSHGEQADVHPERGLPHPEPDAGGPAVPVPGQIREDAAEVPDGAPPPPVGGTDGERQAVPAPAGDRPDSQREAGTDAAGAGEIGGSDGGTEGPRPVEMGGSDEHLQGPGGGSDSGGAGVQLNSNQEGQISLFPSEQQQIEAIQVAESAETLSAPSISEKDVDDVLRRGTSVQGGKLRIYEQYQKGISHNDAVKLLKKEYGDGARSYTFSDGTTGFVDFRLAKGFVFWRNASGEETPVTWTKVEKRLRLLFQEGTYLTPEELEKAAPAASQRPESPAPLTVVPPAAITQADIDAALQEWNGDIASKRRVQQYMMDHAREKETAAWLRGEYGDNFPAYPVHTAGSGTDLPWSKVQRHLARLVREDRFFTEAELENFADVDAAAVREQLEQGQPSAFVKQVIEDVERLAGNDGPTVREIYEHYKPLVKEKVLADQAYRNACANSDHDTAILEGRAAVERAARSFMESEDMGFIRLYSDMAEFHSRLHREIIGETYPVLSQVQLEQAEAPDLSNQPVTLEGDSITIRSGDAAHEADITISGEEWEKVVGAADLPPRDPMAPAYKVGDTVYLEKKPYIIADVYPSNVNLQDPSQTYPILRSESKSRFEASLLLDSRNGPITEFLPMNLETCNEDMREVLASHLFTSRDKYYISGWFRASEGNSSVAHRLSELFAGRAETVELDTGEKADYFTSTVSIEINILDNDDNKKAVATAQWSEAAALLRGLWLQELDGFAHDPPPLKPTHLEGQPSYAVGDHVVFPYHDHDVSGTIEYIGEIDVRIDTGPYAWSHVTVDRDFFVDALRQDERNTGLFVRDAPIQEAPVEVPSESPALETAAQPSAAHELPDREEEPAQGIPAAGNFRITNDNLGVGGPRAKYRMNVEAIRTLKQIEREGRSATAAEQEILSRYVGWGGVPDAFDKNKTAWLNEYDELKGLLTPEEYKLAKASTLNAHYTSPVVIKAMYEAVESMGFKTGKILEPSCGVGNFFGLLPESMSESKLFGVELDSITGRIAQQLYPEANIAISGFERANFPDGFFDLAIGNVPFGNYKVVDQRYDRQRFLIHDYFFAKTIDKVRPGGVIAFITSNGISGGTMDKKDDRARCYIARRCDLLGAVRLPDGAFQANAGTDTSMSMVFLQKREAPLRENDPLPDWVTASVIEQHMYTGKDGEEHPGFVSVNRYFQEHPEMVLGDLQVVSGPFGPQLECRPREGADLAQQLHEAISHIHGEFFQATAQELDVEAVVESPIMADPDVKEYSYAIIDGEVYYREDFAMVKPELSAAARRRIVGMVELRDCVYRLIDDQMRDDEAAIAEEQETLNTLYDAFTAKFGLINSRENSNVFSQDNSYYLLCSLEVVDEDGKLKRKADMFTKRTIKPHQAVTHVDTAAEALAVSIGEHACVDLTYMARLTGKVEDVLERELSGVIFRDIQCEEQADWIPAAHTDLKKFRLVSADEYLSGNVRRKLRMAKAMYEALPDGEKHKIRANVEALEAAQPKDLEASEINLRLGAAWLDKRYVQQFMYELLQTTNQEQQYIHVQFSDFTGEWRIAGKNKASVYNIAANTTYGTGRMNAYDILEDTLNLRDVRVYDTVREGDKDRRVLNQKETTLASQKQQMIKDAFRDWIWKDPARRQDLVRQYNEMFNSIRPREYDGRHIVFGGINPEITLREHQLNAIAHTLYGGNTLLAHEVGAGKTFEMVASAMESKRLGLCHKSLFVVPNHLIEQWASEFLRLYPSANILVTRKKDFEKENRKKFCARIATGNYDAIIMGHSQFTLLPVSYKRREALFQEQIMELEQGIAELEASGAERFSVKQLERTKKSLESDLESLISDKHKDDVVTFEQLGVDRLFVDEAHAFKNLFLYTKMRNVAGLSTTSAKKSSDMLLKCRYLDEITGGRGVVFATGTPVSNSMTELFTMQRYLQQNLLEKGFTDSRGRHFSLTHFDSWASIFGETVTTVELAPEGKYRPRTRFARFFNLPELMAMFQETADIKTADQLHLPVPEAKYHTVKALPSEQQKALVKDLADRAAAVHSGQVDPRIDNMLAITNDGRKLGLDQRLINPLFPDNPESKVNLCVNNVFHIWQEGQAEKLTQLLFCDLSTPKAAAAATKRKTAMAAGSKTAIGTELHALGSLLEDTKPEPPFSVYEDIRSKLIALGIPEREIAFIHDANTDAKKKALFSKVRSGQVRVLMGSTFKMGAGMNVQDRLIALHDLDCPWRPGDLEQRKGRIVRQGNSNPKVHVYRYVTEGTFDSYLWQTVENKQKFISQIMTSKSPVRSCEDVDETALSYAEIKALCAGNPLIREKMDLDIDVARLRLLKADHESQRYRMEDNLLRNYPQQIQKNKGFISGLEADMRTLAEHPHPTIIEEKPAKADGEPPAEPAAPDGEPPVNGATSVSKGFAGMEFHGELVTDKAEAGKLLIAEMRRTAQIREEQHLVDPVEVGKYRGFSAAMSVENFGSTFVLTLQGQMTHRVELGMDVVGNFLRIDHALDKMPERIAALQTQINSIQSQMEVLRNEVNRPFAQESELQQKSARLAELNAKLGIDDGTAPAAGEPAPEERLAKEVRPSVLNNLKRPLRPRQAEGNSKPKRSEQER